MTPKRVLVTGGAGFIGSHVVDAMVEAGVAVRVVDKVEPARPRPRVDYVVADLRHQAAWAGALDGVDAVCHQAAKVGLGVDLDDVVDYVGDNDAGTASLIRVLHRQRFRGRLVLASSMVVYGEGEGHCREHGDVRPPPRAPADLDAGHFDPLCPLCRAPLELLHVRESAPLDPRNVYAATKVHQEHLCAALQREGGVPVAALRYHNVYGPGMPSDTPYAGVASIFRSALAAGQPPQVFEDGGQQRDFVHVSDVAQANLLALTMEPAPTGPFNIASGQPRTVADLATVMASVLDGPSPVTTGTWRPGDVRHIVASPARAREVLGFCARVSFESGMAALASATT